MGPFIFSFLFFISYFQRIAIVQYSATDCRYEAYVGRYTRISGVCKYNTTRL